MKLFYSIFLCSSLFIFSCTSNNENNLTSEDKSYINKVIPFEENEVIELFETNGGLKGVKTSGNFITNKRLSTYWVDDNEKNINFAFYKEIDSIKYVDRRAASTFASYIEVYSQIKGNFKVYIDADSSREMTFYNHALNNLIKNK